MTHYPWKVRTGTALSQLINAAVFAGHPNMSMSHRAWREHETSHFWSMIRVLADWLYGPGHCSGSVEEDRRYAIDILQPGDEDE